MIFFEKSINQLEYIIVSEGLHPVQSKIEAIKSAPVPTNVTQLKSFLGLIIQLLNLLKIYGELCSTYVLKVNILYLIFWIWTT